MVDIHGFNDNVQTRWLPEKSPTGRMISGVQFNPYARVFLKVSPEIERGIFKRLEIRKRNR